MKRFLHSLTVAAMIAGIAGAWWLIRREGVEEIPDEKKAAMELLAGTQTGPGYFHPAQDSAAKPDEHGIIWIEPVDAEAQVSRILEERKLGEPGRGKLLKLIGETSEAHPSRTVGGDRINLARLNLALDSLR